MRRDFVKNGRAQRLHVYCCFMKRGVKKGETIYINDKSGKYEKMSKLSSKIDVLKSNRAQRLHNYCGLRKNRVDSGTLFWSTMWSFFQHFCATWPILGAILGRAGSQRGSTNHVFGYHVGKMTKKRYPTTRPEKTSNFD